MTEFIDRAKLEAMADERYRNDPSSDAFDAYMQAVDDVITLLDAETTEEWGEARPMGQGREHVIRRVRGAYSANRFRRVLYGPWLPSEGGEKP